MAALRLIPATDASEFPYQAAKKLVFAIEDIEVSEVDFPAMIEHGKTIGWTAEMIDLHWGLMKRRRCFDFTQFAAPFLQGTLFENNIFFSFTSQEHEAACQPMIADLAERLKVRISKSEN